MSSPTSCADHGDSGFDRWNLANGKGTGDDQGTNMITTSRRIDLWHKRDRLLPGPSTATTMAGTTAWPCHTGDTSMVEVKHVAQKGLAPHPEHDWAMSRVRGATKRLVDVPSRHGGADRRRWRCFGSCGGQNEKLMVQRVPWHRGEAKTRLSRGRGSP